MQRSRVDHHKLVTEDEPNDCNDACRTCVDFHDEFGGNYIWLQKLGHGPVEDVWFEEPIDSNNWKRYNREWWETHCQAVSHEEDLIEAHVEAFINPRTRFAKLMFLFKDRTLMEPTRYFYELEYDYFNERH